MDPPEADDTLSLWGLTVEGTWERLWHTEGSLRTDSAFTVVYVPLAEPKWFHPCLRLKWTTWGSTYGAYDNWFIAYTYVQRDTIEGQKAFFSGFAAGLWGSLWELASRGSSYREPRGRPYRGAAGHKSNREPAPSRHPLR